MASARKKVIVRRFSPGLLRGYLEPAGFVRRVDGEATLQLLDLTGKIQEVPLAEIKSVSFVREFHPGDEVNPERLPRKTFLARPRTEGLWVRLVLRDEDLLEGLAPLDLSIADSLLEDAGIQFVPPDIRGNAQRLFVPRSAITSLQIVAVVTSPARRKALERPDKAHLRDDAQPDLFSGQQPGTLLPQ